MAQIYSISESNENFGGIGDFYYVRQAGSLCKNPGCQNICGPLHFYPKDLQQKIKNQEFNLPKRCVDCITASRLPMPQQVANAVRLAPTAHSDATWTARSSNAHPGGPSDKYWSKLIAKGAGGLCKISGCVNLCGPLLPRGSTTEGFDWGI